MKRDREGIKAEGGGAIDQVYGRVGHPIVRILGRVEVKVYFQHIRYLQGRQSPRGPASR